ncbi:hypothetical protein ABMA27_008555 [Loxostege sticticalis]|uniref:Uncharacterized protein n=1 Tax=Loxostege sticticalis TaxID=481309 RepID=A0ABR3HBS2_LOXSC
MCILFLYVGSKDDSGDYSLILASNRDEYYDRPASNMVSWEEDPSVYGGRDLQEGCNTGTWLALSPVRKKLGVLLNLPGSVKPGAKSRGKLVADYVKSNLNTKEYIDNMGSYIEECNEFVLITVEFGESIPSVQSYSNASNSLSKHNDACLGFGNSLPDQPLRKVEAGRQKLEEICSKYNKIEQKEQLVNELLMSLLKSKEMHLPDPELEKRKPDLFKQLSSTRCYFAFLPYLQRTHTLILVTKGGHVETIEVSMLPPIDPLNPKWQKTEYQFDL